MEIPDALESFRKVAASLDAKLEANEKRAKSLWMRWQVYVIGTASWTAGLYVGHRFIP